MARGASAARRMELNRSRIDQTIVAIGAGLNQWAQETCELISRNAPDSPYMPFPLHEGLPNQGGALIYFDSKKIYSVHGRGRGEPRVPRAATIRRTRGLVMIIGWGFPARFNEYGTAKMDATPFVGPGIYEMLPRIPEIAGPIIREKLAAMK